MLNFYLHGPLGYLDIYLDLPLKLINNPNRTANYEDFTIPFTSVIQADTLLSNIMLASVSLSTFIDFYLEFYIVNHFPTQFVFRAYSPKTHGCTFTSLKVTYIFMAKELKYKYDFIYTVQQRNNTSVNFNPQLAFFPNSSNNCFVSLQVISIFNVSLSSYIQMTVSN